MTKTFALLAAALGVAFAAPSFAAEEVKAPVAKTAIEAKESAKEAKKEAIEAKKESAEAKKEAAEAAKAAPAAGEDKPVVEKKLDKKM